MLRELGLDRRKTWILCPPTQSTTWPHNSPRASGMCRTVSNQASSFSWKSTASGLSSLQDRIEERYLATLRRYHSSSLKVAELKELIRYTLSYRGIVANSAIDDVLRRSTDTSASANTLEMETEIAQKLRYLFISVSSENSPQFSDPPASSDTNESLFALTVFAISKAW